MYHDDKIVTFVVISYTYILYRTDKEKRNKEGQSSEWKERNEKSNKECNFPSTFRDKQQ